jgi:hypothetical protein
MKEAFESVTKAVVHAPSEAPINIEQEIIV